MALESIYSFEAKLKLISETLAFTFKDMPPSITRSWKTIRKSLQEANAKRNKSAHGRLIAMNLSTGKITAWMPFYSSTKIANATLTTTVGAIIDNPKLIDLQSYADIEGFTQLFSVLAVEIGNFLNDLRTEMNVYRQTDWFKRINRPKMG